MDFVKCCFNIFIHFRVGEKNVTTQTVVWEISKCPYYRAVLLVLVLI